MKRRILACILAALLTATAAAPVWADEAVAPAGEAGTTDPQTPEQTEADKTDLPGYEAYLATHAGAPRPALDLTVEAKSYTEKSDGVTSQTYAGRPEALVFGDGDSATYVVTVPQTGLYHIGLVYAPIVEDAVGKTKVGLTVNGKAAFDTMGALQLSQLWEMENGGKRETDARGNQILPDQQAAAGWLDLPLQDPEGRYNTPLYFALEAGENTLHLTMESGGMALAAVRVFNATDLPAYSEIAQEYQRSGYQAADGQLTFIEAEDFAVKSDTTILPDFDKSDAATQPNDPAKLIYNYLPGSRFQETGQWVTWRFTVPETGLYNISMRVRQATKSGYTSSRRLYIDGEVPFDGCNQLLFESSNRWYRKTLSDGEEDYLFYFEEGRTYELKLEVIPGPLSDVTLALDDAIYQLNSLYRGVVMVAGVNPDKYRDYNLASEMPGFREDVSAILKLLKAQEQAIIEVNGGKSGSALTTIRSLINRLEQVQKNPDQLAKTLGSFKSDIESLSSWNMEAKNQPLDIDYIAVHASGAELPGERAGLFAGLLFNCQRLFASYTKDYGVVGQIYEGGDSITVWLTLGRDQLDVFKKLIDNEFTKQYGIKTNVALVPTGIREAVLAGKSPDVALYLTSDEPMNLAIRNALVDLTQFDSFRDVQGRFKDNALLPFELQGGCYALPITETFPMMFVRTDVFDELGLKAPDTWEEMYEVAAVLQRKNMEIGIPSTVGMFATLLFQNGGRFYADDLSRTRLDSEEAVDAFQTWTDFFSQYGFPLTFDFYNRFRSGEMPLGIAPYTTYTMLQVAAPEIANRWRMLPLPGVKQADGTIDRSVSISNATGTGTNPGLDQGLTSGVIFRNSRNQQAAWTLLDWFTSTDVQVSFGTAIEAVLGPTARYAPANTAAFLKLPWEDAQQALLEQWDRVQMIEEIPGSYYVTRGLNNAFRRVIYDYENPIDTLNRYNIQINKEIARRRSEMAAKD